MNSWAALDLFAVLLFEDKVTSCPHFGWNVGMLNWSWLSSNLFETLLLVVAILHAKTIGNAPSNGYALEKMTKTYTDILFLSVCKSYLKLERNFYESNQGVIKLQWLTIKSKFSFYWFHHIMIFVFISNVLFNFRKIYEDNESFFLIKFTRIEQFLPYEVWKYLKESIFQYIQL